MRTKKKILFIDDDMDFGLLLSRLLADKPFDLLFAYTLSEGMRKLEKEQPEHIFLDNNLPDGLGWEKEAFILAHYPLAQLNLLSAMVPEATASTCRIIEKPISLAQLLACLNHDVRTNPS